MTNESRLVIAVDATKAKPQLDNLNKQMQTIQTSGDKASKSVDIFGEKIKKAGNESPKTYEAVKKLAGVMGTLAGASIGVAGALAGASIAYAKSAKELSNFARLADANVVEFQRMAVAAKAYGVSNEQLSDQLKDFNEKLGEFVLTGGGEAKDAFELLSKNAKMSGAEIKKFALEMQKASGPDALLMYVNRLEKAGVSQEQMSFLVENMGNDLTKLLPILKDNGKEMKAMADEAQRLGVIMDEKAVKQALELEKQINKLQMQIKGATNQFMSGFVPSLIKIGDATGNATTNSELLTQAGKDMGQVFKGVTAIAMGAYVAISSVARSIIGVAKDASDAASSINSNGGGLKNWIGVRGYSNLLTTGILAFSGKNSQEAKKTTKKTAEDYATFMDNLYAETKQTTEKINKELSNVGNGKGITTGIKTFNDKMAKEAKEAGEKATVEVEKLAEAQNRIRYEYADKERQIEMRLADDIQEIRESKIDNAEVYIEAARKRAEAEKDIYLNSLNLEINEFKLSELAKLKYQYKINRSIVEANLELSDTNKKIRLQALDQEYALNKQKVILQMQEREFQAKEMFMTETDAMNERYRLEQANILLINDEEERTHLLELKRLEKEVEVQQKLNDARDKVNGIKSRQGGTEAFDAIYNTQAEANNASSDLMNWEIASGYKSQEEAQIEHLERMKANAQEAHEAMIRLQFNYGESITGSLADMFKTMGGEQSKAYKVMFAASKAFAIADSAVQIGNALAKAMNAPFPLNLAQFGIVAAQTASIVSNIKSVKDVGFQTGGYTGNGGVSDVAGVVHGQEYVLNASATKRVGVDTLNAINSGGSLGGSAVNITINTPVGYTATTREDGNGVTIDVVEQKIAESWSKLSRPNSNESRAVQSSFGLQPAR